MDIQEIDLARLLIDETLSPRDRLNSKHVEEFIEMGGEWPPVLVCPIEHKWYTHQLIDGFHRTEAAQRLTYHTIKARVEGMDAETAIARALRENLHGLPIPVEYRKSVCVRLHQLGWKQERIAHETGVTKALVSLYLAADRTTEEVKSFNLPDSPLSIPQAAAIGKLIPSDTDHRRKDSSPRLLEDPKREAARAQVPTLAKAASDHKLPPPVVSALADATLAAPEEAPRIIERAVKEKLAPDAIRAAGKVLADPAASPALKASILEPETLIQDAQGRIPASEIPRLRKIHEQASPAAAALPFANILTKLQECVLTSPQDSADAWLDCTPVDKWEFAEYTLRRITEWATEARSRFDMKRRSGWRLVENGQ